MPGGRGPEEGARHEDRPYCQYVWGMGHLFRSLELARALAGHQVILVAGGQEVAVDLPGHVKLVRLPGLLMDEHFTTLMPGSPPIAGRDSEERAQTLSAIFEQIRPRFSSSSSTPSAAPRSASSSNRCWARSGGGSYGRFARVCSLRDVLVEKHDPSPTRRGCWKPSTGGSTCC